MSESFVGAASTRSSPAVTLRTARLQPMALWSIYRNKIWTIGFYPRLRHPEKLDVPAHLVGSVVERLIQLQNSSKKLELPRPVGSQVGFF